MKKIILITTAMAVGLLTNCVTRRTDITPATTASNESNTTYLTLSQKQYDDISNGIKTALEDTTDQLKITDDYKKTENAAAYSKAFNDFTINKYKKLIAKYPELQGFSSVLDLYITALSSGDPAVLESFAIQYPAFFTYVKDLSYLALNISATNAALLNSSGQIKVDDALLTFSPCDVSLKNDVTTTSIGSRVAEDLIGTTATNYTDGYRIVLIINSVWVTKHSSIFGTTTWTYHSQSQVLSGVVNVGLVPSYSCLMMQKCGNVGEAPYNGIHQFYNSSIYTMDHYNDSNYQYLTPYDGTRCTVLFNDGKSVSGFQF